MANSKLSGLAAVAAFLATHEYYVNEAGTSKKITGAQLIAALPQGTLPGGYAFVTANQGTFTAQTDITGVTVTVTLTAGRRYRISYKLGCSSSVTDDTIQALLIDTAGPTTLDLTNVQQAATGQVIFVAGAGIFVAGASGAKTYKIAMVRAGGTGNVTMNAGPTFPAYILAEDIGT